MTTIVYRDGVIAGDSRVSNGDTLLPYEVRKIARTRRGALVGASGLAGACRAFFAWAERERGPTPDMTDSTGLIISSDGRVRRFGEDGSYEVHAAFVAIGSGQVAALGTLYAGADAELAVKIAAKIDPFTGGEIQVERLSR